MSSSNRIKVLRSQAFERQSGRCYYCCVRMWLFSPAELPGVPGKLTAWPKLRCTAEHLLPQSEGGRDTPSNIAAACAHCNQTRHKRKLPPKPAAYIKQVRRRVASGRWHDRWVFYMGLAAARHTQGRDPGVTAQKRDLYG